MQHALLYPPPLLARLTGTPHCSKLRSSSRW